MYQFVFKVLYLQNTTYNCIKDVNTVQNVFLKGFTRGNKHNKSISKNKSSSENYSTIFCIFNQVFKIYYTIKLSVLC